MLPAGFRGRWWLIVAGRTTGERIGVERQDQLEEALDLRVVVAGRIRQRGSIGAIEAASVPRPRADNSPAATADQVSRRPKRSAAPDCRSPPRRA